MKIGEPLKSLHEWAARKGNHTRSFRIEFGYGVCEAIVVTLCDDDYTETYILCDRRDVDALFQRINYE